MAPKKDDSTGSGKEFYAVKVWYASLCKKTTAFMFNPYVHLTVEVRFSDFDVFKWLQLP